jgi:hypothetical protein
MQYRQKRVHGALQLTQVFLDKHNDVLSEVNTSGARAALNDAVLQLSSLEDRQDPTRFERMSELVAERTARDEVRENHMRPIASIARVALPHAEELDKLRLPHQTVDSHTLTVWARAMAKAAELHSSTFLDHGLAPDFVAKLQAATEPLEKAWKARSHGRAVRVGVTDAIRVQTTRALGIIGVIDALVTPRVARDALLSREWAVVKRIARRAVRSATVEMQAAAAAANSTPVVASDSAPAGTPNPSPVAAAPVPPTESPPTTPKPPQEEAA